MNCRLGVQKHLAGGELGYNPTAYNLVNVFDVVSKGYRSINLETVTQINSKHLWGQPQR